VDLPGWARSVWAMVDRLRNSSNVAAVIFLIS
jgi:hypothetical protein